MPRRRLGPTLAVAMGLGIVGLAAGGSPTPAVHHLQLQPIAATTNYAAVVIDTGQQVKKFCLAFPEDEITGAEALRRVDAQVVFANFGSRGQAVCSLCGTGCPSSNCFCDANRFWAYHRAGPGGAPYSFSRTGASATTVRNGDVEGWKWGAGEAPPAAKVSEVCNVDEPPARSSSAAASTSTTSATSTTTTTAATGQDPLPATTTTAAPLSPITVVTPTSAAANGSKAPGPPPVGIPDDPATPTTLRGTPESGTTAVDDGPGEPVGDEPADRPNGPNVAAGPTRPPSDAASSSSRGTVAVFVALLGGVLVWRARLRRSKVRSEGPLH